MGDTYVEYMVKRVTPFYLLLAKVALIVIEVLIVLLGLLFANPFILIIATALGFGVYFLVRRWDLEYEYIYQNGELVIDKIMSKAARKTVYRTDLQAMELMFKGRNHEDARAYQNYKVKDFTTRAHEDRIYTLVLGGGTKILFEPNDEMIDAIRMLAPRKVKMN